MDEVLYKSLPIQRINKKYEISRIKGAIEVGGTDIQESIFDTMRIIPLQSESDRSKEQFERKSLFFRSKDYKLLDLHNFLES